MRITVLLDLDGVLMDHVAASTAAVHSWLGARATPDVVAAWFAATDRHLADWRDGRSTWAEQRRDRLRDFLPVLGEQAGSDDELDALFALGYGSAYARSWRGFDDAPPALVTLRRLGTPMAVLTNGSEEQQRAKLLTLGLLDLVGPAFTAERIGLRKPDPRAFQSVCDRLRTRPCDVLYVGDEYEVDVLGARAAGLRAVLLDRVAGAPAGETEVITTLAALPEYVEGIRLQQTGRLDG